LISWKGLGRKIPESSARTGSYSLLEPQDGTPKMAQIETRDLEIETRLRPQGNTRSYEIRYEVRAWSSDGGKATEAKGLLHHGQGTTAQPEDFNHSTQRTNVLH
jgi:hypothetical protein